MKHREILYRQFGVILNCADAVGDLRQGERDVGGDGFVLQEFGEIGQRFSCAIFSSSVIRGSRSASRVSTSNSGFR
jgi:hypothetical protein